MEKEITLIERQKNNPDRVNIFIDGDFAFPLSRMAASWLKTGQLITEEKIQNLKAEDAKEKILTTALRYIAYKPRTEYEVEQRLKKNGASESDINYVLERLREAEVIDDHRFASDWAETRSSLKPRGQRLLRLELLRKHISEENISAAMQAIPPENESAEKAAHSYAVRLKGKEYEEFKKRLSGFLLRRGFQWEVVSQVTQKVWEEENQT